MFQSSPKGRLGPLEQQVLAVLWRRGSATVKEVIDYGDIQRAYSTVMTTLDRLHRERLVDRVEERRAFRYTPRLAQDDWAREAAHDSIRQLLSVDATASRPLSYLVEAIIEYDVGLLDDLQRPVREKRRILSR